MKRVEGGDIVSRILACTGCGEFLLIEYEPTFNVEDFSWGLLMPALLKEGPTVVADFFGVGAITFRNYTRRASGEEYSRIIDLTKGIKVIKVGPGSASYGELIEELAPAYEAQTFLRNYHSLIGRVSRLPVKPRYLVTFGLGHYVHFGGDAAILAILTAVSTLPVEDLLSVHLINRDVIRRDHLAILEGLASAVFELSSEGVKIRKGGVSGDKRG
ncbi:DUF257 family protein [Thermococcus sp.]|uniref:DUF257 family protein n=1 Tax=Thermococcus sp. TaxID=35749 RepID=UPI002607F69B|nr:DUF257 family protein [Thermococcus sp.]